MLKIFQLLVLLVLAAFGTSEAMAKRVALVIGNDSYSELPVLKKAVADAEAFAATMTEQGFDRVILRTNLDRTGMDAAISDLLDVIEAGDTAVFFFSGHGWSDGTQNYLVAVDAPKAGSERHLARISIPLQNGVNGVVDEIGSAGAALKIAIIDACRDNPFVSNTTGRNIGQSRGLVGMQATSGSFIVFSAGAGQAALDRLSDADTNPNSVFTRTLLPLLRAKVPLDEAINATQQQVYDIALSIGHTQEPAYYDQVRGSTCLSAECVGSLRDIVIEPIPQPQPQPQPQPPTEPEDKVAYNAAVDVNTCGGFNAFVRKYPSSFYADLARERAAVLCAPPPQPEPEPEPEPDSSQFAGIGRGTWFVILGSVPHSAYDDAAQLQRSLARQGIDAEIVDTDSYSGLADGLYAVVVGPFRRGDADNALGYLRDYVGDAYVKSGS